MPMISDTVGISSIHGGEDINENQPAIAARVASVEPLDHPSDGELVAFARRFFKADDRMRSQFRPGMHQ